MWAVVDAVLMACSSIIHMVRKTSLHSTSPPNPDSSWSQTTDMMISQSPVTIKAARHAIKCLRNILVIFPRAETMMALLGCYRGYLPFSILANNIVSAADPLELEEDIKSLESLTTQAAILSRGHSDVMPLIHAMQTVNAEIQSMMNDFSGMYQ
jgi:hypothetical protein